MVMEKGGLMNPTRGRVILQTARRAGAGVEKRKQVLRFSDANIAPHKCETN